MKEKKYAMPEMPSQIERLQRQIDLFKEHTAWRPPADSDDTGAAANQMEHPHDVQTQQNNNNNNNKHDINFSAQIPVSDNLYKIPIKIVNHDNSGSTNNNNNSMPADVDNLNLNDKNNVISNVYTSKSNGFIDTQLGDGNLMNIVKPNKSLLGVINSVENFQLMQKPLAEPLAGAASTAKIGHVKTSEASDNGKLELPNAPMPEQLKVSSTTAANRIAHAEENFGKPRPKPVPHGVVPIQVNLEEMINRDFDANQANENGAAQSNNRYGNVADAMMAVNAERKKAAVAAVQNNDANDANVAHEVNDNNDFIVYERSHKEHMPVALGDNKFNVINNAAEEDLNLYDNNNNNINNHINKNHIGGNEAGKSLGRHGLNNGKLANEIEADGGRMGAYADGDEAHMEEQLLEEGEDGRLLIGN